MTRQLSYVFEELPLLITGGFSAGLVNGSALLSYWPDGQWSVAEIYLDGHRRKSAREIIQASLNKIEGFRCYDEKPIALDRGTPLHSMIWDRLESDWRQKVQEAVNEAIEEDRESAADDRADMRRDEMMLERVR